MDKKLETVSISSAQVLSPAEFALAFVTVNEPQAAAEQSSRAASRCGGGRASRARAALLARWLQRLQAGLAALARPERKAAIERLPVRARAALLDHMELLGLPIFAGRNMSGSALPPLALKKARGPSEAAPTPEQLPCSCTHQRCGPNSESLHWPVSETLQPPREAPAAQSERQRRSRLGVRAVPTGLFQASVSFNHILVRSGTSRSHTGALRFLAALRRFKELAMVGREERVPFEVEEYIRRAHSRALAEAQMCEEALRPSYCTYVSFGPKAGKVESPTTASLDQVLTWRRLLLDARPHGWLRLRSAWVQLLQEERPGHSVRLSALAAEARADKFFCRHSDNIAALCLPKQRRDCSVRTVRRIAKAELLALAEKSARTKVRLQQTRAATLAQSTTRANARAKFKSEVRIARAADKIALLTRRPTQLLQLLPAFNLSRSGAGGGLAPGSRQLADATNLPNVGRKHRGRKRAASGKCLKV